VREAGIRGLDAEQRLRHRVLGEHDAEVGDDLGGGVEAVEHPQRRGRDVIAAAPTRGRGSGLTRLTFPQRAAYGAIKGAVEVLTRYMAAELGPRGITANVIAPGAVATDFSGGMLRDNPEHQAAVASITALGRTATADDIGPAIANLLRPGNHWITGQRIEVSGGMHL